MNPTDVPRPTPTITPAAIQQKEFRVSRLGGYKMRDVDVFLDELTEAVGAMQAELERLRSSGSEPLRGTPDLDDATRQADEIIARARAEAARITADARVAVPAAGAGDADAVRAFLTQERGFLYELGELVQSHAANVKAMVRASKGESADPSTDETRDEERDAGARVSAAAGDDAPAADEGAERAAAGPPDADATVRLDEAVASGSDGSLRELFWGSDEEVVKPSEG
jgi:DivIVA domain-containing protein